MPIKAKYVHPLTARYWCRAGREHSGQGLGHVIDQERHVPEAGLVHAYARDPEGNIGELQHWS